MNILRRSQRIITKSYGLSYEWNDIPGAGWSFPCDEHGAIIWSQMSQTASDDYEACQNGTLAVTFKGIVTYVHSFMEHARGRCCCGKIVDLISHTNECDCGRLYNLFGQDLAPRSQRDPLGEY